ncbi:MAG: META domain-containing protein [Saprospiraceae bacterium]|nr:META domain-containing protein [Saprospiraceae bacterium]
MRYILSLLILSLLGFTGCKAPFVPTGTSYNLTQLFGQAVPEGGGAFIQFDTENKRYSGSTGCNNFNSSYTLKGKKLTLDEAATTKKMCADMKQEERMLTMLSQVTGFEQKGTELKLMGNERVLAVFSE